MAKVVFYCHDTREHIDGFEYYRQDIDALLALGHNVTVCSKYREIPLDFDAMFVWWWTHALPPVLLCQLLRRPCLITGVFNFAFPAGFEGRDYFRRPLWQRMLIRSALTGCSLNLFVDERERQLCASHFKIRTGRYYPCVVHDDYLKGPGDTRSPDLFNVTWSGRGNLIRKGIPDLLEAMRILKTEGTAVHLRLAGLRGDGADYLEHLVGQLDLHSHVTLLGPLTREEKITWFRRSEIYVQPSHYEGFGLAIAEAMGCGACVVVCDVGAVTSVVGDSGIYVQPGSPAELAGKIREVVLDGPLRRKFQAAATSRAQTLFASDQKVRLLRNLLLEVEIS